MAFLSENSAIAVAVQSAPDTFPTISSSADVWPCANLRMNPQGVTADSPEYRGTVHKAGPFLVGETVTLTLTLLMRPPGGASPPAAGAFIPGRFYRSIGFTENILAAAIPAAAEALGASSTTTKAVLGTTAAGTADLYKGLALTLSDNGSTYANKLAAIAAYDASKGATLAETLTAPPAANYQIPKQLAYQFSASSTLPLLATSVWLGKVRYDLINLVATSAKANFPTANNRATDIPSIDLTYEGQIYAFADEDAPVAPVLGAAPIFKDGDLWLAGKALGGSSFSIDFGVKAANAPNPNKPLGQEAGQITETVRTANFNLNHNLKATIDFLALARAQAYQTAWAQYGYVAGGTVSVIIPAGRFNIPGVDNSGDFVTQSIDMFIDDAARGINITFPY